MQYNPVPMPSAIINFIYDVMQYYTQWDYSNPINGIVSQQDCTEAYNAQGEKAQSSSFR